MRTLAGAGLLLCCAAVAAFEPADLQGLRVRVDAMHEPVAVDGLSMHIRRAQGAQVAELAARMERRWQAAGSMIERLRAGEWDLVSRWDGAHAELLQWRGRGEEAELLHSRVDMAQRVAPQAKPPFRLPPACQWGRSVSGTAGQEHYGQRSALCRGMAELLMRDLMQAVQQQGWQILATHGLTLHLRRRDLGGVVVLSPGRQRDENWLVWIGSGSVAGARP